MRITRIASRLVRPVAIVVVAGSIAALCASSVGAEDAAGPPGEKTEIMIGDEISVPDLLRLASKAADVPILWSDQDKAVTTKKVQGARRLLVPKGQVFDAIRDLLTFQEIAIVPIGTPERPIYIAMDARMLQNQFLLKLRPEFVELDDATAARLEGRAGLFIATTIRAPGVENLRDLRTAVSRLVTGQNVGNVQEIPSAQALFVTDYAPNVVAMYRFVRALPAKPEPKVEFFVLTNARAADVESTLVDLMAPVPAPRAPAVVAPAAGADAAAALRGDSPRFASDVATNQVIVVGTQAQIDLARQIIQHVDTPPRAAPGGR